MSDVRLPSDCPDIHPVQRTWHYHPSDGARVRKEVIVRAYEVYCHLYGPQDAMMSKASGCRGGFSTGELVGFLYARTFPRSEWRERFEEALRDMKL